MEANVCLVPVLDADGTTRKLVANPVQFDETPPTVTRGPQFAEHTDDILRELFSQAGQAIRDDAVAILGPRFTVRRLLAVGQSQSAGRLVTYVNGLAQLDDYDGYLIQGRGANGAACAKHR